MKTINAHVSDKATIEAIRSEIKDLEDSGLNVSRAFTCPDKGPAIYVGFWGCYNEGDLYGSWLNLEEATTAEQINGLIDLLRLAAPQHHKDCANLEEWMAQDSQCLPSMFRGENPDLNELETYLESLPDLSADEIPAFEAFNNNTDNTDTDDFREAFCGYHGSIGDYAFDLAQDTVGSAAELEALNRWPCSCIDWERAGEELRIGGDIWTEWISGYGLAVFSNI